MAHPLVNPHLQSVVPGLGLENGRLDLSGGGLRVDQKPRQDAGGVVTKVGGKAELYVSPTTVRRPRETSATHRVGEQPATRHLIGVYCIDVVHLHRIVDASRPYISEGYRHVRRYLPLNVEVILYDVISLRELIVIPPP